MDTLEYFLSIIRDEVEIIYDEEKIRESVSAACVAVWLTSVVFTTDLMNGKVYIDK